MKNIKIQDANFEDAVHQAVLQAMGTIKGLIEKQTEDRVRGEMAAKLGLTFEPVAKRGPGRPRGTGKTKVIDATATNHMRKPCPVPDCPNMAAPRHGMVCKGHNSLPKEEIALHKFRARQPGGRWYAGDATAEAAPAKRRPRKAA